MSDWVNHASFLGHIGKYGQKISDPLAWVGGDKWTHLTSDVLPGAVNGGLSAVMKPFEYVDKTINPVRKIPIVNRIGNIVAAKPGDSAAIAAGAFFGGSAALAAGGAGGAGAGAGAGAAGAEGGALGAGTVEGGVGVTAGAAGEGVGAGVAGGDAGVGAGVAGGDVSGAEAGTAAGGEGGGSAASSWRPSMPQQQKEKEPLRQLPVEVAPTLDQETQALMVTSSRAAKGAPGAVSMTAIAHAGASGADQVSENGVHIGAIRALNKRLAGLEAEAKRRGIKV